LPEIVRDGKRDNIQRWCEKRDKTKEKTKLWGILKKRMTKEKYNRTEVSLADGS